MGKIRCWQGIQIYGYEIGNHSSQKGSYSYGNKEKNKKGQILVFIKEARNKVIDGIIITQRNKYQVAKLNANGAGYGNSSVLENKYPKDI